MNPYISHCHLIGEKTYVLHLHCTKICYKQVTITFMVIADKFVLIWKATIIVTKML